MCQRSRFHRYSEHITTNRRDGCDNESLPAWRFFAVLGVLVGQLTGCAVHLQNSAKNLPAAINSAPVVNAKIEDKPFSPDLMYNVLVGEIAGQRGQFVAAATNYLSAAKVSTDARVAQRASHIALFAQDLPRALQAAQRWVQLAPDDLEARQVLAMMYVHNDQVEPALEHFERLLSRGEQGSPFITKEGQEGDSAFLKIAALLSKEPNKAAAMDAMKRLVSRHGGDPYAHFAYGQLALQAGDAEQALRAVTIALRMKSPWPEAQVLQARTRMQLGDGELAVNELKQAVAASPDDKALRLQYARLLLQQQQVDAARAQFDIILSASPEDAEALLAAAVLTLEFDEPDLAEEYLLRVVKLGKRLDNAYYYLGRIAQLKKNYPQAKQWYEKVSQGDEVLDAQIHIAHILALEGDVAAARNRLNELRARVPMLASRIALAEGEILMDVEQYQEAMNVYGQALQEQPNDAELLYARALTAEKLGRLDLLEQDLRAIIARDPQHAHALNALGYTLADRTERYDEALRYIERALKLEPDEPMIMDSMGWINYRMQNFAEAVKHLRRAYDLSKDAEVAAHLGEVLWVMGDQDAAREVWQRALKDDPDSAALRKVMQRFTQ